MILEMRVYRCIPGRLPALLKRFDTLTLKLWDKHGIKQAGFYTTLIGTSNQELTYFLAWDSLADREKKWAAFQTDPDWLAGRARSEEDGQIIDNIVSQLLVPTAFSAGKEAKLPHGIDHIVHAVRNLDAAGALYRRLGFTVGARNRHDWGTHNLIVQFKTAFVELLEIGEPEKIPPHQGRFFSFGAFNRDYIRAREG